MSIVAGVCAMVLIARGLYAGLTTELGIVYFFYGVYVASDVFMRTRARARS